MTRTDLPVYSWLPAGSYEQALDRTSGAYGIEPEYWDIWGRHHVASGAIRKSILASLGVDTGNLETLDNAASSRALSDWAGLLPPTIVIGESEFASSGVPISVPASLAIGCASFILTWEDGSSSSISVDLERLPVSGEAIFDSRCFIGKRVIFPEAPRLGYHTLSVRIASAEGSLQAQTRLIVAPDRAYQPDWLRAGGRAAGIGISLYGLRSTRNWGCGDTTDLEMFCDWAAGLGVDFVALNTLHAIPNRQPYNTSPYLPNCAFYRNLIYLDIERIEEFQSSRAVQRLLREPGIQSEIAALRASETVEYERVQHVKLLFLKLLFREFLREWKRGAPRSHAFVDYAAAEGDLLGKYALHEAIWETIHRRDNTVWNWHSWPEPFRDPDSPETHAFAQAHPNRILFFKYIQWQLDLQLAHAQKHALDCGMRIGLYHDLALATDRFGADLWAHRPFYASGASVGAPPDDFSPNGQDWGFPPPNSERHFQDGYRLFADSIRQASRHGGALRIDHVMRFFRLYWIPEGLDAATGAYIRDRYEDLIRVLALESVRNRTIVIGEDLGTVPDFVRETLGAFGIFSYRLFYFEQDASKQFRPPDAYPRQALVSAATHDLPTLAGFWRNRDIEARRAAGLLPGGPPYDGALADRVREKQKILDLLFRLDLVPSFLPREAAQIPELTGELHSAIVGFLASTPSQLLLLNQEDLFKDPDQQNLPGSTSEYPNWRHKMRFLVEELGQKPASDFAAMFENWLLRSGRRPPHMK
ncbi:MAG: 4-alpha-glucanotransferase [Bryobacteraceae bacterium]